MNFLKNYVKNLSVKLFYLCFSVTQLNVDFLP
jgi:hypothetical protein